MPILLKKKIKKPKNKYILQITQNGNELQISGHFRKTHYKAKELWLFSKKGPERIKVASISPNNQFTFKIDLHQLMDDLRKNTTDHSFNWFIKIRTPLTEISDQACNNDKIEVVGENGEKYAEYFIRLGRFQQTDIKGLGFYKKDDNYLINYITIKGNLSLLLNEEPNAPVKLQIDRIKSKKGIIKIEGKIFTRNSLINDAELILKGRETNKELKTKNISFSRMEKEISEKYGLNRYNYSAEIDFRAINGGKILEEDIYDLYINLGLHDNHSAKVVRIGRPTGKVKLFLKEISNIIQKEVNVINPYFTFKGENLSLEVYRFPLETFKYLKKIMRWSWLIRLLNVKKNVWLVGERVYKAQDTGYAFFKYMRTKHPEERVYYVIDKKSKESANVEKFGNVLDFKSKEHIWFTIIAKKVISSHHPDYLYPIRTNRFKRKVKADKIFLQHGVMGTKNMVANYGKNAPSGFNTDFFIVSSDFEKEMIVNDFGYDPKDVFVTGLSRFDTLFENDVKKKRQILIIPTWRDWIINEDVFFESEYYCRYKNLLTNEKLHNLAKQYKFEIVFCLHPNMQKYTKYFDIDSIKIINQGDVDVQYLIKESALMITDYSSVAFDFSFLHKPVIYYQFDRSRFIGNRPSHLDLDNDLPGDICFEEEELLQLLEEYVKNNFEMKPEYVERSNKFIKYRDKSSCDRIYSVIKNNKAKRSIFDDPKISFITKGVFNRFRKSKFYFPTMKLLYKLGSKIIPVDKNLILFESGLGKQYADSPRYIYEEILNQGLPYKKVWVYNNQRRFNDPDTKRIKRLSPSYYYYLLKAGYWVNNQNFPTYIKKRRGTIYLQTWHGTPLKKMLYDIKKVQGRNEGYVERVGRAIKNWDYLISPSPYATKAFKSAFRYDGNILEVGYPRNDIFYKKDKEKEVRRIKNRLMLKENKKIILYAPTFRDNQTIKNNKFFFELNMDLAKMKEHLGSEYILLLRTHVVVSNKLQIDEAFSDFVFDVSNYPDIQELLLISDILITDYSSVMFDYANTGRPMIFYTYDLEEYRDDIRGFYIDFEKEAPGPLVFNTDEIIENILNIDRLKESYREKYTAFVQKYCPLDDGNASKRVVEKLFKRNI